MVVARITANGVDITADVMYGDDTKFIGRVNGDPGEFSLRVRDDAHVYNFSSGDLILLELDSVPMCAGYALQPSLGFMFPVDDTVDRSPTRFWMLKGADQNILLPKRVVYDKSNPINDMLTPAPGYEDSNAPDMWVAGSPDNVVLKWALDNFTDLSDVAAWDDATIQHIGSPNPDKKGGPDIAVVLSDFLTDFNKPLNGVFYLSPVPRSGKPFTFWYVDQETPSTDYVLTDTPSGPLDIGYREMTNTEDGMNLANEALVWGVGIRPTGWPITIGHVKDEDSINAHGLWQWAEIGTNYYKQATVDARADSIVNGTPQSLRGHKDPAVSYNVTVFANPGMALQLGTRVRVKSDVFGLDDVLPIRQMQITFPASKSDPRFDLILSHEIDTPYSMMESWWPTYPWPRWGGFPRFGGGGRYGPRSSCVIDAFGASGPWDAATDFADVPTGRHWCDPGGGGI